MQVTAIGLDITKRVLQIRGLDAAGTAVVRRKPRRAELLQFFTHLAQMPDRFTLRDDATVCHSLLEPSSLCWLPCSE